MLQMLPGSLGIPDALDLDRVVIWAEQQVWGHRFWNDQSSWLVLLEALNLMASRAQDQNHGGRVFPGRAEGEHETMRYDTRAAIKLRQLLFTNLGIQDAAERGGVSDAATWSMWLDTLGADGKAEFGYLKERFANFASFNRAVALLKGCQLEPEQNRRYTSCHLAPRGPAMLSGDFDYKRKQVNKDRRFFRRGGEMLYLMLNRSGLQDELEGPVKERLLSSRSRWNRLAAQLSPKEPENPVTMENIGYLPVAEHPTFRVLAEDWIALLSLEALPDDNLSEPLMRLSGLSVVRFLLERGADILGESRPLIPVDALGPDSAGMRKLSRDALTRHREMTRRAVEHVVDEFLLSPEWLKATSEPNPTKAASELAKARLNFVLKDSPGEHDESAAGPCEVLAQAIREAAIAAHNQSLGLICGLYSEQIGMAVRRAATRRYAFSDAFLEALVLANVREPMEFEAFLRRLHDRYGFVVGEEICRRFYSSVNQQQVQANQRQMEERLRMLGLSKRLSDDCAFVLNPFWTGKPQ